jgi:four helix bundle protein
MDEKGFEGLKVWQKAHQMMLVIHTKLIPALPKDEKWGLRDQIMRSSKSIGANIAEGYGRFYYMDNVRFCYNARGSLDETINHIRVSYDLNYCPEDLYRALCAQGVEIRKIINGYIAWLKAQKTGKTEPGANLHIREIPAEYSVIDDKKTEPDPLDLVTR